MLDNITEPTTDHSNTQSIQQQQPQQTTNSNSQISVDFDSILQELKSVGQAHQSTTMIIENITTNIKQEIQTNSSQNEISKKTSIIN